MEENKKWSVTAYDSLKEAISGLGENYGQLSLHFNAAITMFVLADPEERERWISLIERARRMQDDRTILERVKILTTVPASNGKEPVPEDAELAAETAQALAAVKPRLKAKSARPAPGRQSAG